MVGITSESNRCSFAEQSELINTRINKPSNSEVEQSAKIGEASSVYLTWLAAI